MPVAEQAKVPAVERALAVLEILAESKRGFSISEMARRLGVAKSSIHLILTTLERRGYLLKNPQSRRYFVGLKLVSLAQVALDGFEVRERAVPFLLSLAAKTGLSVHMAVLEGNEAVLIERIESPGLVKLNTWVGQRMHINCTAVGKVLTAFLSEEEFKRTVQAKRLIKHNQNTISSIGKFREELSRVRAAGYAVDDEEEEVGVRCVGAPVFDHSNRVVAALSVAGTTTQIPENRIKELARLVQDTGTRISRELGYARG
jgi:DNA-binding IclR family transcriptional regulator